MDSQRTCHIIPPEEERCVWMEAGVLSYQLCDRHRDCENCPTDAAMHRRFAAPAQMQSREAATSGPQKLPEVGYQYSRGHWWVHRLEPGLVRAGVESGIGGSLLGIKGVVLPPVKQRLRKGQACVWVVMDGGTVPLDVPLDGVVRAVNRDLVARPYMLSMESFNNGWLFDLEVDEEAVGAMGLMPAEEARPRYAADMSRFMNLLSGALRGRQPQVGPTLADGGEKLQNFADILGPARYLAIVRQSFCMKR